ncbi:P-loop containing nucleoside triphosphate hydrolase protein [Amylocystis lapponica]|nr:P-loop containing nucleoside triphosphate hydrolase protein [Amylocystis lapponica]
MAPKRAVSVDSDIEDRSREGSQASKRARTEDVAANEPEDSKPFAKGKRRRAADDDDDEEEDMVGPTTPDEDEEKKFEEEHEEEIRERLMSKGKTQGGIAEMGIIESLEMHQFMCHKYLTFSFGPQINFIIGGKSAVLSALTVALGGKATSTGRGSGLKSFIREGQAVSEVSVSLKNQGEEAYKPKEYGKSIVITRRFTKEGSSSYKIKSRDGKVISTKREELSAICDHMNIQVDNPMNILTQDSSFLFRRLDDRCFRQFLSASQPSDKYRFFLRGTQLSQLSEEYQTCLENISQTQKVLKRKSEVIPDLEDALKEASTRFEEAAKAREQRHRADELKKELAWAHVATKEQEMKTKFEEVAQLTRRVPKIQEKLEKAEADFDSASQSVAKYEEDLQNLGEVKDLTSKRNDLGLQLKANKAKISQFKDDEKQISNSIAGLNIQIAGLEEQIRQELQRIESYTQGKREETNRKLEKAQADLTAAERQLQDIKEKRAAKIQQAEATKEEGLKFTADRDRLQHRIVETQEQLRRCGEREQNKLAPYGRDMNRVLEAIQRTRWYGQKPVGPFGLYVTLKDPERWAGFAVTDARDQSTLSKILKSHGNNNCQIVISEVDLFDYSAGEPPESFLTVLRALNVSDAYVLRILINQARIESTFLAPSPVGRGGVAWSADSFRVQRFPFEGGGQSSTLPRLSDNRGDPRHQLFTGDNVEKEKKRWSDEIHNLQQEWSMTAKKLKEIESEYNRLQGEIRALQKEGDNVSKNARSFKMVRDALQEEANEDLPVGIQALQDAKKRTEVEHLQRPLLEEQNRIKGEIAEFENRRSAIGKSIETAVEARMKAQNAKIHYAAKLEEEQKNVSDAEDVAKNLQDEFEAWSAKAEEYCERYPRPRKADEVQRLLDGVQTALREREKRHALRRSVKTRLTKWHEFRRHIALRCKVYFSYHLSNRGYYGKVLFDHVNGTLQLKVQTDDQTATQTSREKDPRSLSGGEKSFSTICLLLSLWESIGCPIRCLDEFDVFMDAVNRRISMKMMIDTANSSNRKQYVLITPQDMTNINIGNTVRVHRMTDPERGQGVLAFQ